MKIFTIGYEATTMAEFIAALHKAGVERVIDVRAVPSRGARASRRTCSPRA